MKSKILIIIVGIFILGGIFNISCGNKPGNKELPIIEKAANFELINQNNEKISFSQFIGKIKVMSFFYTRCNMPNMCPKTTKNFQRLQESLGEELGKKTSLFLISFDPEHDTPGMLRKYGELYGANLSNWHFLTGDKQAVEMVQRDYGIIAEKQEQKDVYYYRHSMITFLIDQNNNVRKMYFANKWEPEDIKNDITTLLEKKNEE